MIRVNTKSAWLGMKYAILGSIARGGGAIVNTGSYLAWHGCELLVTTHPSMRWSG